MCKLHAEETPREAFIEHVPGPSGWQQTEWTVAPVHSCWEGGDVEFLVLKHRGTAWGGRRRTGLCLSWDSVSPKTPDIWTSAGLTKEQTNYLA